MGNRLARIGGPAVTACVGLDEHVIAGELFAPGVNPIFLAACAAMKKKEWLSGAFSLVIHPDIVNLDAFSLHARIMAVGGERNNLVNGRDKMHDPLTAGARYASHACWIQR